MNRIEATFNCQLDEFALNVSLDLPGRGVTAIFGSSGSGKTTLLRCVAGLERTRHGYLKVNGHVWQDHALGLFVPVHQRPLGFVFQEASLFAHLNVRRNLDYGLRRLPQSERRVSLGQAIELLGISHLLERQPETLSGGERQRVAIARALAASPRLLLMDEPLASLDMQRKAEVLPYLERLHEELDIAVLYVSHSPDEVTRLADHVVMLDAGRVLASGSTRDLLTRLDLPLARGDTAAAIVEAVVTRVEHAYHLSHAAFSGGEISLLNTRLNVGQCVRVRIQARDVSLTLRRQENTSILNIFTATVTAIASDSPGQVMVCLTAGDVQQCQTINQCPSRLLARITRKSADALGLQLGTQVFAQVKAAEFLR